MLSNDEVLREGFKPLIKTPTQPQSFRGGRGTHTTGVSFVNDSGEQESTQQMWENSQWTKLEKSRGKMQERGNSFVGYRSRNVSVDPVQGKPLAVVIVDPFSTGAHLAVEVVKKGFKCVRIFSIWDSPLTSLVQEGVAVEFDATVQYNDQAADIEDSTNQTVAALEALPFHIVALIPGAETGVELADRLSERLGLRSNGQDGSEARRNKYLMGEKVRSAGVRAVKQKMCRSIQDVQEFVDSFYKDGAKSLKVVVKPIQSAGSDDVFLCRTLEEAEIAFQRIFKKVNGLGLVNDGALIQEFLEGKEYVVDQVSKDGVHKIVAIWEYDKRQINNAAFVYFGMKLVNADSPRSQQLKAYADRVLDALGIVHGPSHMEVMYNAETGPCLVEVGARCHGGEGTWLPVALECVGFTKVQVVVDMYTGGGLWESLDPKRYPLKKTGMDVDLVSHYGGIVRALPGDKLIRSLASFRSIAWDAKIGEYQSVTIDCFTRPGCVQLVHESEEQVNRDFEKVHELEKFGLIDYAVITPTPPNQGAVVIVDPFSTGANIAATIMKMGYKLILVFSELNSPVAKLVSKSASVQPTLLIQHDSAARDQDAAISQTLRAITEQGSPVLAILPGAETGVELSDHLAARFGTRNNGESKTEARRNKFMMQELIKTQGIRSIQQKLCYTADQVLEFYNTLPRAVDGKGAKCVVKPNMSAGTDSVHLCETALEAVAAFQSIDGHMNGLGHVNEGALCQEFLIGTEYVLDGVCRDGIYKVIAIWQYDKRFVNDANFVYFGMRLRSGEGFAEQQMIQYGAKVVEAMGIVNGPSHMEIMYDRELGPCLVEVGARCHGGEGTWLPVASECVGYTQLDATLNAYLRPDQFDILPLYPSLLKQGCEAFLVSYHTGNIKDIPGIDAIRQLPSFRRIEMLTQPGAALSPTIDCFTRPGSVQLVNKSSEELEEDYAKIRELEFNGLFDLM